MGHFMSKYGADKKKCSIGIEVTHFKNLTIGNLGIARISDLVF